MNSFDDAFARLMLNEGHYSNNPQDPGGETMWGITARIAHAHGYEGPMRDLPQSTARIIAKKVYWDPLKLDLFEPRISYQIFDAFYNGGHPVIWMQASSNSTIDGILGPETIANVQAVNVFQFQMRFLGLRILYFTSLKTWESFGKGWMHRVAVNLMVGAA
jgi:lysozyme family protein